MFSGTESETKEFMQVCVQTVNKYPGDDYRSPVFIFERLCSIIFPVSLNLKNYFNSLDTCINGCWIHSMESIFFRRRMM